MVVFCVPKKILGAVGEIKKREMSTFEERRNNKHPLLDHSSTLSLLEQRPHRNGNHRIIISLYNAYAETYRFATYNADVVATATAS